MEVRLGLSSNPRGGVDGSVGRSVRSLNPPVFVIEWNWGGGESLSEATVCALRECIGLSCVL